MIQRIQSVWLLLAAVCIALTFKLPFYSGTNAKGTASYELKATESFPLLAVTIIAVILSVIIIFLFKQRAVQLRLCVLAIVLEALLLFLYYRETTSYSVGTYSLWSILHGIAVFLFFLAARAINKDEKLMRESDRLR
ncbi:MAG: DUF4293 domain-containing protein [Bacteroidetes bacterium]|nr:DUF4293 domain-containing protein [Bacteroidota bacterium]